MNVDSMYTSPSNTQMQSFQICLADRKPPNTLEIIKLGDNGLISGENYIESPVHDIPSRQEIISFTHASCML